MNARFVLYKLCMTIDPNDKIVNQAIIAREIIDIYFKATSKANVAESL